MEFGRLDDLTGVDFTLPPDAFSPAEKWGGKPAASPDIRIACPSWGIKTWVGKIYPPKTPATRFLTEYGRAYNAIEHNGTRYKLPTLEQAQSWAEQVPTGFRFSVKFPEIITHQKQLLNCEGITDEFIHALSGFGEKLGPCLLLVHPNLSTRQAPKLFKYLQHIGTRLPLALELRHASWYEDAAAQDELCALLDSLDMGFVLTDVAGRRDALHMRPTGSHVFIRWTGNQLDPTDYRRLDDWAERLKIWLDAGASEIYFYIHQPEKTLCPESCRYLTNKLNALTGLNLPNPHFYNEGGLFD